MPSLRLLSVNATIVPLDRAGLARMIADRGPDVACVHGAPSLLRWRSISAAVARNSGLVVVAGGRTAGGNLLLSSLGVDVVATRELSFTGTRGVRPPGAVLAALRLLGSDVVIAGARLGRPASQQARQLSGAVDALLPADVPSVLCVDSAGRPDQAARAVLAPNRLVLADQVFIDRRLAVTATTQFDEGATEVELTLD